MLSQAIKYDHVNYFHLGHSNQLLSENNLYTLNSTYNFCALKNLQSRFQDIIHINNKQGVFSLITALSKSQ